MTLERVGRETHREPSQVAGADQPLFTIAIPTFNRADWIGPCVHAALAQSCESFEVVVSDNASNDRTAAALSSIRDARLRVLRQATNIGPNGNWNACVAAARGTYFVLLCDDDLIAPHFLARCAEFARQEVPVIVALGDVLQVDGGAGRESARRSQRLTTSVCNGVDVLLEFLCGRISPQLCTVAMRTDRLRARGGFPAAYPHTGDLVCWVPLLLEGKVGFVNESCGTRRSHEATLTAGLSLDTRITDVAKLAGVIADAARERLPDGSAAQRVTNEARVYFARHALGHIAMGRKMGLSRREVIAVARRRPDVLRTALTADPAGFVSAMALVLMPLSWLRALRAAKRALKPDTASVA